jgi:hypothetical protein
LNSNPISGIEFSSNPELPTAEQQQQIKNPKLETTKQQPIVQRIEQQHKTNNPKITITRVATQNSQQPSNNPAGSRTLCDILSSEKVIAY